MFHVINTIYEIRRRMREKSFKSIRLQNKGLRIGMLFVFMLSVDACSGVPLVPGI